MLGFLYRLGVALLGIGGLFVTVTIGILASEYGQHLDKGIMAAGVILVLMLLLILIWRWVCFGSGHKEDYQQRREPSF